MLVEILEVASSPVGTRVRFACEVGAASARWLGGTPLVGEMRHVELDAGAPLTWGRDLVAISDAGAKIATHGSTIEIDAVLERCDADGVACLRVGPGLLIVETAGTPPAAGTAVRASLDDLVLSDTNL